MLALRFGWTEQDIWQSSPDFIDELIARCNAETALEARAAQARQAQAAREATIARMRSKNAAILAKQGLRPVH